VLFTSGLAFLALALCWLVIDGLGRRRWAMPFVAFGRNAILAFFLSGIMARLLGLIRVPRGDTTVSLQSAIWHGAFEPLGPAELASLLFALSFLLLWIGIAWVLYRRRIFFKV